METEIKDYGPRVEELFIQFMVSNHDLFVRCRGIIKEDFFDDKINKNTIGFIMKHAEQYSAMPSPEQIHAVTGKSVELIEEVAAKEDRWFLKEIETFCRYKALREAILASPELLEEGRYGEVESAVKSAVQIALVKDLGTDYFKDPKSRLEEVRANKGQISTGWKTLDKALFGGVNRGEISIFAGQCVVANTSVSAFHVPKISSIDFDSIGTVQNIPVHTLDYCKNHLYKYYTKADVDYLADCSSRFVYYLYNKLQPSIVSIFDLRDCNNDWFVDSPDGYVPVVKLISKGTEDIINVLFSDYSWVNTSPLHCFEREDGQWISTVNLNPGDKLISNDGTREVLAITDLATRDLVFDLVVDSQNHRYYTNGVSSHNSGAGKSLFLQNLAVNWVEAGLNIVYISLELSERLCSMRIDSMVTGYETREVLKNIDNVHMKVLEKQRTSRGSLQIKQLPNGCTANDVRAFIKEYEIHSKKKVDGLLIDYLDLMMPISARISAENMFVKDKYVTEELRNVAVELDILCVTASQLNRGSYEESSYNASHISGGISKVNTADNVIGIFTSAEMKAGGRYQIQLMKTRSSSGVGSVIDLAFDPGHLRISDMEEGDDPAALAATQSIQDALRRRNSQLLPAKDKEPADTLTPAKTKHDAMLQLSKLINQNRMKS